MPLRTSKPKLTTGDRPVARLPPKVADKRYATTEWRALRLAVLCRDGYRCAAPGCMARAQVVDHIVSPRNGGTDDPSNLRSLCRPHDMSVKEDATGTRRGRGLECIGR